MLQCEKRSRSRKFISLVWFRFRSSPPNRPRRQGELRNLNHTGRHAASDAFARLGRTAFAQQARAIAAIAAAPAGRHARAVGISSGAGLRMRQTAVWIILGILAGAIVATGAPMWAPRSGLAPPEDNCTQFALDRVTGRVVPPPAATGSRPATAGSGHCKPERETRAHGAGNSAQLEPLPITRMHCSTSSPVVPKARLRRDGRGRNAPAFRVSICVASQAY